MIHYYDKNKLKQELEIENIYDLLLELGAEPEYAAHGLVAQTICHNHPGEGSRKLYYYSNSHLFNCYTSCGSFDIFSLLIKIMKIQKDIDWELYDAMRFIAAYFGLDGSAPQQEEDELQDWKVFRQYDKCQGATRFDRKNLSNIYDNKILDNFLYPRILSWENEGISTEVIKKYRIGYYPSSEQITIPHFNSNGELIGIRGRFLATEDIEKYGKYRPLYINKILYSHPLSLNLYGLNETKENITRARAAVIFESEKSVLQLESFYGAEGNIGVACCGSNISDYQINALIDLGVREVIIGFDRQFQEIGDEEFKKLKQKLLKLGQKYKNKVRVSAIFDKNKITPYKASPSDCGKEIFEKLLTQRISL